VNAASKDAVLTLDRLSVRIYGQTVVNEVSLAIKHGECIGLVGESGCGKTMTALAIMGLLPGGATTRGSIRLEERELLGLGANAVSTIRGRDIGMVFQEPLTALNPVQTIGAQIAEMYRIHERTGARAAQRRAIEALAEVQLSDPDRRARAYPHELSGGMRQRAMLAMALACRPKLLIADEPTTALDVTVQAQILDLVRRLAEDRNMAILFITHNLAVISDLADEVLVMYAGRPVETAPTRALFEAPEHPYSAALLATVPRLGHRRTRLPALPTLEESGTSSDGCAFARRCQYSEPQCHAAVPPLTNPRNGRRIACFNPLNRAKGQA